MKEEEDRIEKALTHMEAVVVDLMALQRVQLPDPVARRRLIVRSANRLRVAAATLDQSGFLTE